MSNAAPNIQTHIAKTVELPAEKTELSDGRPDLPVPSLWQIAVSVVQNKTGRKAVVARVDHSMMLFRAYYPDEHDDKGNLGRFSSRTEWMHCSEWTPETTFSPSELKRQEALAAYEVELAKLDDEQLALASVLCDDADPAKALGKLKALIRAKLISLGSSEAVAAQAVADVKGAKK